MGGEHATPGKHGQLPAEKKNFDPNNETVGKSSRSWLDSPGLVEQSPAAQYPAGGANLDEHAVMAHYGVDAAHPTGSDGIDTEGMGACAEQGAEGCFLTKGQRMMLIINLQARLQTAQTNYGLAVSDCRLKQVLKKTDELPWYLNLLIAACFSALEGAISAGVKALRHSGEPTKALAEAIKTPAKLPRLDLKQGMASAVKQQNASAVMARATAGGAGTKAFKEAGKEGVEHEAESLSEKQVETLIKTSVDNVKEAASSGLAAVTSAESTEANEKSQALSYIENLRDNSALVFQDLKEGPPGYATDMELLALWRAFDASLHTVSMYRGQVNEKIEQFLNSNISKMGRQVGFETETGADGGNKYTRVEKEVRVAWVVTKAGKRLAYMDRVFSDWYQSHVDRFDKHTERSGVYDGGENQFSLDQESDWKINGKEERRAEKPLREDRLLNYVEPEFEKMALKKQEKIWLNAPETYQEDWDHQVAPGVPKIVKIAGS